MEVTTALEKQSNDQKAQILQLEEELYRARVVLEGDNKQIITLYDERDKLDALCKEQAKKICEMYADVQKYHKMLIVQKQMANVS